MTLIKLGIEVYPDIIDEERDHDYEWCSECHAAIDHKPYFRKGENGKKRKLCSYCYKVAGLYGE